MVLHTRFDFRVQVRDERGINKTMHDITHPLLVPVVMYANRRFV
jgi:hypothetical protein